MEKMFKDISQRILRGEVSADSLREYAVYMEAISLQSYRDDVLQLCVDSLTAPSTDVMQQKPPLYLVVSEKFHDAERPGLETLDEFAHGDYIKDVNDPRQMEKARTGDQLTSLVRAKTQEYLSEQIRELWKKVKNSLPPNYLCIPSVSGFKPQSTEPCISFEGFEWKLIPASEAGFSAIGAESASARIALLKTVLQNMFIGFTMAWKEENQDTAEFKQASEMLSLMRIGPDEAFDHGFNSAIHFDLESTALLFEKFCSQHDEKFLTDQLIDQMLEEQTNLMIRVSNFYLRVFAHFIIAFFADRYPPETEAVWRKNHTQSMADAFENAPNGDKPRHQTRSHMRSDAAYMRYKQTAHGPVPILDFNLASLKQENLQKFMAPGARRGCPAKPIIPEFSRWLHGLFKAIVLPAIRREHRKN